MASGIDRAPAKTLESAAEGLLQLLSPEYDSSSEEEGFKILGEAMTESDESSSTSAPAAQPTVESNERVLRARPTKEQEGAGGTDVVKTPKILAREFLRLKGFDPKSKLRQFSRDHNIPMSTLQYQLKQISAAEEHNLLQIGRDQAKVDAKSKRTEELEQRRRERIEEQKRVGQQNTLQQC